MKKFIAVLMLMSVGSLLVADIHEPPKAKYTKNRKWSRGWSNIFYSWTEVPATMIRYGERHTVQSNEIWTAGFWHGLQRSGARLKYGVYEVVNFQRPIYKDSYRPLDGEHRLLTMGWIRGIPSPDRLFEYNWLHSRAQLVNPAAATFEKGRPVDGLFCVRPSFRQLSGNDEPASGVGLNKFGVEFDPVFEIFDG